MTNSKSVAGVEGALTSFTLYSPSLENERVVIAVMFPMPASKTNFSNFAPWAVDEKENRNQPLSQLASLKFTAVSAQAKASLRSKILKHCTHPPQSCWTLTIVLRRGLESSIPSLMGHFKDQPSWEVAFWGFAEISKTSEVRKSNINLVLFSSFILQFSPWLPLLGEGEELSSVTTWSFHFEVWALSFLLRSIGFRTAE